MKLTSKDRDTVETLLNSYSALCSAEARVTKKGQLFSISVNNERNDSDFVSIGIDPLVAKEALAQEKAAVAAQLAEYDVQV